MWFYYHDLTTTFPVGLDDEAYYPFRYNYYIMRFFDRKSSNCKLFISITSNFLILILCCSFSFILYFNSGYKFETVNFPISFSIPIKILFVYENKIYILLYSLSLIAILFNNEDKFIKNLFSSKLFTPFNKIAFTYFCLQDLIIHIFYSNYNVEVYLNIRNPMFITFALFIIIFLISCILTILFEIPLRIIYQNLSNNFFRKSIQLNFEHFKGKNSS